MYTITSRYYWHGIQKVIERHVKECMECQRYKATNLKSARLYQTVWSNKRFEVIAIKLLGPLPTTPKQNQWLFIVKEIASKWVELFPLEIATGEASVKTLRDEVYDTVCQEVISDNGAQFVSAVMEKAVFCFNIKHTSTPVYHPESKPVERKNCGMSLRMLKRMCISNKTITNARATTVVACNRY